MKLFQSIRKSYSILGISSNQDSFGDRMLLASLIFILGTTSSCVSLFSGTKNFNEYTIAIFVNCVTLEFLICFTNLIFKMTKLFELIDFLEILVSMSELNFQIFNYVAST